MNKTRLITLIMISPFVGFGIYAIIISLIISLLGGPKEPPLDMSWEDFELWKESGEWMRYDLIIGSIFIFVPLIILSAVFLTTREKNVNHIIN